MIKSTDLHRPEEVIYSALFAVGDAFSFIGEGYTASHVISSIDDDGWIHFSASKMLIHRERFEIAFGEGRARRVDSANA